MNPLFTKLQELGGIYVQVNQSKLKHILILACCILKTRTTCIKKNRDEVASVTGERNLKRNSVYKRLLRIFQTGVVRPFLKVIFLMVLQMIYPSIGPYLIMDRTDFSIGERWVNLLVIGVEWHGIFIPLTWKDLGERKSSNTAERLEVLDQLLAWWKASGLPLPILQVIADREFIGQQWISALIKRELLFVIRMKSNLKLPAWLHGQLKNRAVSLKAMARYMKINGLQQMEVAIKGTHMVNLMLMPQEHANAKEDFVLLLANLEDWKEVQQAYRHRWPIECCFKHMKSNGFNLEDINLEGDHKVNLMFAILTMVYVLAVQEGILKGYHENIKIITYADGTKGPEESLFRYGLFYLKQKVQNLNELVQLILEKIQKLIYLANNQFFINST